MPERRVRIPPECEAQIALGQPGALGGIGWGFPHGPQGFGPPAGMFGVGFGRGIVHAGSKAAAAYLGITQAQLRSALASGQSLARIAQAHGKTAHGLVAAIVAAAARLDRAVAAKDVTSAQEQAILGRLEALVRGLVTHSPQQMLQHGFALGFRHRFRRLPSVGPPVQIHAPAPQL